MARVTRADSPATCTVVSRLHINTPYRLRQPSCLVAFRRRLPPRVRFFGRSCQCARVSRQSLGQSGISGTWARSQRRELGSKRYARRHFEKRRKRRSGGRQKIRDRRFGQSSQGLGVPTTSGNIHEHRYPTKWSWRLGPRRRMESHTSVEILHRVRQPR